MRSETEKDGGRNLDNNEKRWGNENEGLNVQPLLFHGLLHCGFSAAFCWNSIAQQLYLHEMRIIFLNRASAETRMRLVVFVFFFSRDCKAGCSYFHGALSCLHSPILRSDPATIVITAGETVQVACFGVGRYLCFL